VGFYSQKTDILVLNKTINIFENIDFNAFSMQIGETVKNACEKFWEQDIKISMQAINDFREIRDEKLVSNIDFFSSQIKVENHKPVLIRLSKDFIQTILETSLKATNSKFEFTKLTPLEVKILNGFCEFLYRKLKDVLIPPSSAKLSEKSEKYINLLYVIEPKNELCSKIMISVPQDRINLIPLKKNPVFKDEDFFSSKTTVRIKAGSSKITFDELQNLTAEDIIVLEESELTKLTLISGELETKFNIKINPSLIVNLNDGEEDEEENMQTTYEEVIMEKNLWDDIQIEINAEFDKVKMTIGELKQITQGQIIDLGSMFDNEISLYVEERKVAKGELIIINDRYAVRINEVLNSNAQKAPIEVKATPTGQTAPKPQGAPASKPLPQGAPQPQAGIKQQVPNIRPNVAAKPQPKPQPAKPQADEEEFDYSDFEK
jgi:flagellar motor switch protein FliN